MADKKPKPSQDENRLREIVDFYDNQTEDEEVAELEAAWNEPNAPMIQVPRELVPAVRALVAHYNGSTARSPFPTRASSLCAPS